MPSAATQPCSTVPLNATAPPPRPRLPCSWLRRSRTASRTSAGASAPSAPSSPSALGCRRPPLQRPKPPCPSAPSPLAPWSALPHRAWSAPPRPCRDQEEAFPDEQSGGHTFEFMSRLLVGGRSEEEVRRSPTSRRKQALGTAPLAKMCGADDLCRRARAWPLVYPPRGRPHAACLTECFKGGKLTLSRKR
jgi:hypothetical protein